MRYKVELILIPFGKMKKELTINGVRKDKFKNNNIFPKKFVV